MRDNDCYGVERVGDIIDRVFGMLADDAARYYREKGTSDRTNKFDENVREQSVRKQRLEEIQGA